jgi:hypothetical protein
LLLIFIHFTILTFPRPTLFSGRHEAEEEERDRLIDARKGQVRDHLHSGRTRNRSAETQTGKQLCTLVILNDLPTAQTLGCANSWITLNFVVCTNC